MAEQNQFLSSTGLAYLLEKVKAKFATKAHTHANMKGASDTDSGSGGMVPAPAAGKQAAFLRGDGTWAVPESGVFIATYGETTMEEIGAAELAGKLLCCNFSSMMLPIASGIRGIFYNFYGGTDEDGYMATIQSDGTWTYKGYGGYTPKEHTHTAEDIGALPASNGTAENLTVTPYLYTAQILPKDAGSYSIGSSDNRYYSAYLKVNPNVSSDRRCKRDIEVMDIDALAAFVAKLPVVSFNYNDDAADEAKRIGLVAQDVVAADPEIAKACTEQDEKGIYSLRAADLVFPLIAAVQALTKRVEELEGK